MSIFGATGTPVLDFWWYLLWVLKPEWVLPYSHCGGNCMFPNTYSTKLRWNRKPWNDRLQYFICQFIFSLLWVLFTITRHQNSLYILENHMSYFVPTGTSVLDFWWFLLWVSKSECVMPCFISTAQSAPTAPRNRVLRMIQLRAVDMKHALFTASDPGWSERGWARNMKYKAPRMVAIFFMTSFNRDRGGDHDPPCPPPPRSAAVFALVSRPMKGFKFGMLPVFYHAPCWIHLGPQHCLHGRFLIWLSCSFMFYHFNFELVIFWRSRLW